MLTLTVSHSPPLERHLSSFEVDGATVASALFSDGRLLYPGRHDVEQTMQAADPYTLWHEARVIGGLFGSISKAIWLLSDAATELPDLDPTLDLLWRAHAAARQVTSVPSLDRLTAALVMVQHLKERASSDPTLDDAAYLLVRALMAAGFPSSAVALEELWDGAAPACVGLNLVELG